MLNTVVPHQDGPNKVLTNIKKLFQKVEKGNDKKLSRADIKIEFEKLVIEMRKEFDLTCLDRFREV